MATRTAQNPFLVYASFILASVGGGLLIGTVSMPDGWFATLVKPSFQPPNWLFGPVWTILYVLIGIAGARIFRAAPQSLAMKLWFVQMVLNFFWSPTFFSLHALVPALVVVGALLITILAFIRSAWLVDRPAALLFLPYALWVSFATLLNASLIALN